MKFLALSALAAFGFLAQQSQATLISNNLFPNFGSENAPQVPTGSNPLFSGSSSPFSFGSPSQQPLNNFSSPSNFQQFPSLGAFNPQTQFRPIENLPNPHINENQINQNKLSDDIINLRSIQRNFNGTRNNLKNPNWGSKGSDLLRLCHPNYQDGKSVMLNNLPNPRDVSNLVGQVQGPVKQNSLGLNLLFTIYGQFLDHDLSLSTATQGKDAQKINIKIPKCDVHLDKNCTGVEEMPLTRSVHKKSQIRTNNNVLTAWLDASQVYGSDQDTAISLREFKNGKLKISEGNLLPKNEKDEFFAGETRVNENPPLNAFHTIFVREHNRLCDLIIKKFQRLTDEEIFQMARNYVIGLIQHITFDQFLPELIGRHTLDNLIGSYKYDQNSNPNIFTQFSAAGFRIGHPLLNSPFRRMDNNGRVIQTISLAEMFFNQGLISNESTTQFLNGMARTAAKEKSLEIVDDIRNFLFLLPNKEIKVDLFSLNLQRGRDHGICSVKQARNRLGLPKKSIREVFENQEKAKILQRIYHDLGNVDLWLAIVGEKGGSDAVMGELGKRLIGFQFQKIRNGDRFWYEAAYPQSVVREIKATSLGDIIKRNSGVTTLHQNVFKKF